MRALLTISVVVSSAYLCLLLTHQAAGPFSVVLKAGSTGLLVAVAAFAQHRRKLLILALAFSVLGDLLLELRRIGNLGPEQLFLLGLVSFLTAHIFYIAMFVKARGETTISRARTIACAAGLLTVALSMAILWPGLAEMRIPVVAYSVVLAVMVITAQLSQFSKLVAIGALFFLASDTMLAMSIFGHPFAGSRILVWITYYVAQLMITMGVIAKSKGYTAAM